MCDENDDDGTGDPRYGSCECGCSKFRVEWSGEFHFDEVLAAGVHIVCCNCGTPYLVRIEPNEAVKAD